MQNTSLTPPTPYTFIYFYENYINIKDDVGVHKLNDNEICQMKEIQQKLEKGYNPKIVRLRCGGSKTIWIK